MSLYRFNEVTKKLFTIAIIVSIVGNVYVVKQFNMGYGEIIVLFAIAICIIKNGFTVSAKINNESLFFLLFFLYSFLISIMVALLYSGIDFSHTVLRLIRDSFYIITVFVFSSRYLNRKYALKLLNILTLVLSVFVIFQFVLYFFTHSYVSGLVSWLPLANGDIQSLRDHTLKTAAILGYLRPNGFLIEPASCAHILSIGLIVLLFMEDKKNKKLEIGLLCIGMILTTSLNAIVLMVVAFIVFYVLKIREKAGKLSIKLMASLSVIIFAGIIAYSTIPSVQSAIHRFTYLRTDTTGSTVVRLIRGWAFFDKIPFVYKIFGIGFGNFIGFKEAWSITTAYEMEVEYLNTASYILISTGIIGYSIIICALYRLYNRLDWMSKGILIMVVITSLSSSIYSSPYMLIAMSLVVCDREKTKSDVNILQENFA